MGDSMFVAMGMEVWDRISLSGTLGGFDTNLGQLGDMMRHRQLIAVVSEAGQVLARPDGSRHLSEHVAKLMASLERIGAPIAAPATIPLRSNEDRLASAEHPPEMVIEHLLPAGGIGALIALPGMGKTLMALAICEAVAGGRSFAGRAVLPGRVVYACTDSPQSTERRMLALSLDAAPHVSSVGDLRLPEQMPELRSTVTALNAQGAPVRLVVIDTWDSTRTHNVEGWAGQDAALEEILRGLRAFAQDMNLAVILVHHATRADTGRARGSAVFDARADWIATVTQAQPGDPVVLESTKCRDGERGIAGHWSIATLGTPGRRRPLPRLWRLHATPAHQSAATDPRRSDAAHPVHAEGSS